MSPCIQTRKASWLETIKRSYEIENAPAHPICYKTLSERDGTLGDCFVAANPFDWPGPTTTLALIPF